MASFYDQLTAGNDHGHWTEVLIKALERHGLRGRRLLDVACGTGESFLSLVDDWQITGCDISGPMLEKARGKAPEKVRLEIADMRHLPVFGQFDLVWCLGDSLNYMRSVEDLGHVLEGMRRNLPSGGLALFDLNTLRNFRAYYSETRVYPCGQGALVWHGSSSAQAPAGSTFVGELSRETSDDGSTMVHVQRHFLPDEVDEAMRRAGFQSVAIYGHGFDAILEQPVSETRHMKAIHLARATI